MTIIAATMGTYREQPPEAHTGGFGEPTCIVCHSSEPLNDAAGTLQLIGLPAQYVADRTYTITVRLQRPGLNIGGFQLAIRTADGKQAGTFVINSDRIMVSQAPSGVSYVHHTLMGSGVGSGKLEWELRWKAPRSTGPLFVHAAANATNDDASPIGDFIYTFEQRIAAAAEK